MSFPFDDTDGPDQRPDSVIDALISGDSFEKAMDYVYLDEDGRAPQWGEPEIEAVRERYRELHEVNPEGFPLRHLPG